MNATDTTNTDAQNDPVVQALLDQATRRKDSPFQYIIVGSGAGADRWPVVSRSLGKRFCSSKPDRIRRTQAKCMMRPAITVPRPNTTG